MADSNTTKLCSVEGCNRIGRRIDPTDKLKMRAGYNIQPRRYCEAHFRRLQQYGDPVAGPPVKWGRTDVIPEGATCSVPECDHPVLAKDLCRAHYQRNYRNGDVHADTPLKSREHRDHDIAANLG